MKLQEAQEYIIERLGLTYSTDAFRMKIDEFLPDVDRTEGNFRDLTEAQADIMVKVCALQDIGVSNEDIKEILENKRSINSIVNSYLTRMKVCNYVANLFEQEKRDDA